MEFEVTDGLGIISKRPLGRGEYFRIDKPVTIVWEECKGSVALYMCLLPCDDKYRKQVRDMILDCLYNDYTNNEQELYTILSPLFRLFDNGRYSLKFYNNNQGDFFRDNGIYVPAEKVINDNWDIKLPQHSLKIEEKDKLDEQFKEFIENNDIRYSEYYKNQAFQFHTASFYPLHKFYFVATRPDSEIDEGRVKFYEEEIKAGKKPFVIAFGGYESYFVLDGHHKLKAYHNLHLRYPPVVAIENLSYIDDQYDIDDLEFLDAKMLPGQIQHIFDNWFEKDGIIERLKNQGSPLYKYFKNGVYKTYYSNGQTKQESFYTNDELDGVEKGWYENGQLKFEKHYKKGIKRGNWKFWYENGVVQRIVQYNEEGQMDGYDVSFLENGKKYSEIIYRNNVIVNRNEKQGGSKKEKVLDSSYQEYINELGERTRKESNNELKVIIVLAIYLLLFLFLFLIRFLL